MVMRKYRVVLFFRKLRDTGNFSIETSFDRVARSFPADSRFELKRFSLSHFSNGILPRLRGIIEAREHRGDVNHVTGDVHYIVLGLPADRTVLTIHDCGFMNHPNPVARRVLKWLWLDWPVRHCRYVTAVSEATKRDIVRYTGCPADKVVVIPTVIADTYHRAEKPFDERCPRILHIGLAHNKNFERHVAALASIECRLHVIGKLEPPHVETLARHGIRYTSEYNLSQADMQCAYAESDLLLFASTLEGFGMPILEAQAVGRAVVTSNMSSMPEVAGDGACLVDPGDVESIRHGVLKVIRDRGYRESLIERGFANIQRFSAESVAKQYESLYGALIDT
jgi:glycosyltransferase involved in cell wall biosynthesis